MTKYTLEEAKEIVLSFCKDPEAFGQAIFEDNLYPAPNRGEFNPFLLDADPIAFQQHLNELFPTPMEFLALFLGRYLPYDPAPNADWQLSSETVYAFIAMSAVTHVIGNCDRAMDLLHDAEPYYSLAYSGIIAAVMAEYCDDSVVDTLGVAIWHPQRWLAMQPVKMFPAGSELSVSVEATVPKGSDIAALHTFVPLFVRAMADEGNLHIDIKEAS